MVMDDDTAVLMTMDINGGIQNPFIIIIINYELQNARRQRIDI